MMTQFGDTLRFEQDAVDSMASRWPDSLAFATASNQSLSNVFPHLFAEAFPAVTAAQLERLSLAGLYVSGAMMELDGIVDDDIPEDENRRAESAFRSHVLHFESFNVLSELFAHGSPFWERFRDLFGEHTDANLTERAFARGARPFADYDEPTAHRVAIGKAAMSRLAVAALTELGGEREAADALDASICAYSVARQIFDDLQDWRRDLRSRIPTPVIAAILDAFPAAGAAPSEADLARRLHYEGHSRRFLASALLFADEAIALAERAPRWRAVVENLRGLIATAAADVARIIEENLARVRDRAGDAPFELPHGVLANRPALRSALEALVAQWRLGFGETRHLMSFDLRAGGSMVQRGDVFARALIVDALEEVQEHAGVDVRPLIQRELDYLISMRRPGRVGGWAYFPELRELPADADDLAQVAIALVRAGRRDDVVRYCEPPLAVLLADCAHDDGSYETWIIPRDGRSEQEELQAHFSRIAWGLGTDPDVMANLLYALRLMDAERHRERIERGTTISNARKPPTEAGRARGTTARITVRTWRRARSPGRGPAATPCPARTVFSPRPGWPTARGVSREPATRSARRSRSSRCTRSPPPSRVRATSSRPPWRGSKRRARTVSKRSTSFAWRSGARSGATTTLRRSRAVRSPRRSCSKRSRW